jgi:SecD/SecF fusion protein
LILKVKKWAYLFSAIVVVVSVISLATNKLDQGVDFVEEEHFARFENQLKRES